jgi:hypothetical protein
MFWLLAQAANDTATPSGSFSRLIDAVSIIFTSIFTNWIGLVMLALVVISALEFRYKLRKNEQELSLKSQMIERGMSADEIERVLAAKSSGKTKTMCKSDVS